MVRMPEKLKYHDLWYLQLNENSVLYLLYFLKTAPIQQINEQIGEIARSDWSTNHIAIQWESFVTNEHTHQYIEEPTRKVWAIRDVLQPITKLVFPQWIMDRYKEALIGGAKASGFHQYYCAAILWSLSFMNFGELTTKIFTLTEEKTPLLAQKTTCRL